MRSYRIRCLMAAPPLIVSSLAIGPAAFARTIPDAVPAASCQVVPNTVMPGTVAFDLRGFSGDVVITNTATGKSDKVNVFNSNRLLYTGGQPTGDYTVTPAGGQPVPCTGSGGAGEADQEKAQEQYRAGFQQGLRDTLATCEKNPPKNLAPDPNWQSGYDKGAETAINSKRCTDN
ncbi:hypothetical protein ACIRO3_23385 [Streptomyces sp. NPDC102278]|uniref:hypothetical protein n=1 Tax=Streptomyces sp. NPDC102278 TaxID=3366152 RepID=UPI0038214B35